MYKLIFVIYIVTAVFALVALKLGTANGLPIYLSNGKFNFNINLYVITGLLLYIFSFSTYMYLISKNDLGYIIPLAASCFYIFLFITSYFVFKETFTAFKIMGIVLILIGVLLLNVKS